MESPAEVLLVTGLACCLIATIALYLYCVIDIHKRKFRTHSEKGWWLTAIIASPIIGALIYLAFSRRRSPGFHR